ncbi:aminotransferase class I/II-fold pyridoxal phosphate-dependent enzyme [Candidatus Woesearchaeota archaeon]|nr:aminotransferase class I/II-fold pyridoxal phosphate-dependent enzyme [Candidatus Woesearchaeota archaeon]
MSSESEVLNRLIKDSSQAAFSLLSAKGRNIFFPKAGILSQSAEAKGRKVNATIGIALEDDGAPMCLGSIAGKVSLPKKDVFPYAPGSGKPELRAKWKELILKKNPSLKSEVSSPIATCALTHGLSIVGYMFIDEGDKVIMPDLYWENYNLVFHNGFGAEFELFKAFNSENTGFNLKGLEESLKKSSEKKKEDQNKTIVVLNFPNNPTGYAPTTEEAEAIRDLLVKHADAGNPTLVVCDDAYFGFFYKEEVFPESLFALLAGASENLLAVKVDGPTKEDYVWGFRVGFLTFGIKGASKDLYASLEAKAAGTIRGNVSMAPHLSQSLILSAMGDGGYDEEKASRFKTMKARYEEVVKVLKDNPFYGEEFTPLPFNSGYFMCVRIKNKDAEKVRKTLLEKHDTGVIAQGDLLRIAFSAVKKDAIPGLFKSIYEACKEC